MTPNLVTLQNDFWQAGILPDTGASIAFGRAQRGGQWIDVLRPTSEADYRKSGKCSSFIMLPWCNRIKAGLLRFQGREYQLEITKDDGTARHGDVRQRSWTIDSQDETRVLMSLDSRTQDNVNFPFAFSAVVEYRLDGRDFIWMLTLKNEDVQPMPAGFGHHPYFVRPEGENDPLLTVPCEAEFELVDFMAVAPPVPISPRLDFRQTRPIADTQLNDLLSRRQGDLPARLIYPGWGIDLAIYSDALFRHILVYTPPEGQRSVAVEPMSNASDGFNLYAQGIEDSGIFVLNPGESRSGVVRLNLGE
jgi:aldose 1-epimerase